MLKLRLSSLIIVVFSLLLSPIAEAIASTQQFDEGLASAPVSPSMTSAPGLDGTVLPIQQLSVVSTSDLPLQKVPETAIGWGVWPILLGLIVFRRRR